MGLISKVIDKTLMMLLPQFAFVLYTSAKDILYDEKLHLSHKCRAKLRMGALFDSMYLCVCNFSSFIG